MADQLRGFRDPLYWDAGLGANCGLWTCIACKDNRWRETQAAKRHENGATHRDKVSFWEAEKNKAKAPSVPSGHGTGHSGAHPPITVTSPSDRVQGPLSQILNLLKEGASPTMDPSAFDTATDHMDWDDHEGIYDMGVELAPAPSAAAVASLSDEMSRFLDGEDVVLGADAGLNIPSFVGIGQAPDEFEGTGVTRIRETKNMPQDPQWFPWSDRVSCVLDILRHLPRSVFSDAQMEIILWAMAILGVNDLPSVSWLKDLSVDLQEEYGIRTLRYQGALGHVYYANSMADQIVQEFGNPRIAPHLQFYPEDAGSTLSETWQSRRWRHEADPSLLTPMVRVGHRDFFIHEPAKLTNGDICMPVRWFQRMSATTGKKELWADVCRLEAIVGDTGPGGFALHEYDRTEVPITSLSLNFPQLVETFQVLGIPDPRVLLGTAVARGRGLGPWTYTTDPAKGNDWRIKAQGCRVVSFMAWLYCDDTSGNMSKKWNKHNSFLWTAAGLPREMAQQQYNVHFLSTSNLAPPLEMLDGIVSQLEEGQRDGIWVWDVATHELVLVIPAVLALLGDNPMQSEMACHIGLRGKFFCRCCWVKGRDAEEEAMTARVTAQFSNIDPAVFDELRSTLSQVNEAPVAEVPPAEIVEAASLTDSAPSLSMVGSSLAPSGSRSTAGLSSIASSAVTGEGAGAAQEVAQPVRKGTRAKETLEQMKTRAKRFLTNHAMRTKDETVKSLGSVFTSATRVGGMTAARTIQTEKGVKDTFQQSFMERIFTLGRKLTGSGEEKQEKIYRLVSTFPDDVMSPVWRIKDLDPHKDTPVEILHVVLLGFVKYFWRDIVTRLNAEQKTVLATRLSSLDVSGLGISPLVGATLVQYAGSLTGRDFRAIAQAGPFVLYDLASPECLDAWVALCQLIPLIWQPEIHNLEKHLKDMEHSIENFLRCTAKWTPRWFNKPKFHLIRHLPYHVRRFGPAILFATEAFESFNAVIREQSIHSNRLAPSRDIAVGFAHAERIRHMLSGGTFLRRSDPSDSVAPGPSTSTPFYRFSLPPISRDPMSFRVNKLLVAGPGCASITRDNPQHPNYIARTLGLGKPDVPAIGTLKAIQGSDRAWSSLTTASHLSLDVLPPHWESQRFSVGMQVSLCDGEVAKPGSWMLIHPSKTLQTHPASSPSFPTIARLIEIWQRHGSPAWDMGVVDALLIEIFVVTGVAEPYKLPQLRPHGSHPWAVIQPQDVLCPVNVQHNCAANRCDTTATAAAMQEREDTGQTIARVKHYNTNDVLLNLTQQRSSKYLRPYFLTPILEDLESAILIGATREFDEQKRKAGLGQIAGMASATSGRGRRRGRGRGRARGAVRGGGSSSGRGQGRGRGAGANQPGPGPSSLATSVVAPL